MINAFYPMEFCKIETNDVPIGHLQIGNPAYSYAITDYADDSNVKLFVHINGRVNQEKFKRLYSGEETGYVEFDNLQFYRNCNVITNVDGHEVLYQGRLPNSRLQVVWNKVDDNIRVEINVSNAYLYESGSRLTLNQNFDTFLTNLILHLSTYLGYMPFHAAGVTDVSTPATFIFMGLPNTGKTTTSTEFSSINGYKYVSEDILFVNTNTLSVFPAPFTFNPKSKLRYRAEVSSALNLSKIIILKRAKCDVSVESLDSAALAEIILNMNYYEFAWCDNMLIRSLFCIGDASLSEVNTRYIRSTQKISNHVSGILLQGNNPEIWASHLNSKLEL